MDYSKHYFRNSDHVMVAIVLGQDLELGLVSGGLNPVQGLLEWVLYQFWVGLGPVRGFSFVLVPVREALSQPSAR